MQKLEISNQQAVKIISEKRLLINGKSAGIHQSVTAIDTIELDGKILKKGEKLIYLAFYKPRGVECTLNEHLPDNLKSVPGIPQGVFPVGRLDKDSEGLLLLTNDGNLYQKILATEITEKEYLVTVNKPLSEEVLRQLASGIVIMGKMTKPAKVNQVDSDTFRIILKEGMNRQIRRMCYKLGLEVTRLERIRIANLKTGNLKPGEIRQVKRSEIL